MNATTKINERFRASLVQELRYGLIEARKIGSPELEKFVGGPELKKFVDGLEASVPIGQPWLRLENVPDWVPQEEWIFHAGSPVSHVAWIPEKEPTERHGWIAVAAGMSGIRIWDTKTGKSVELDRSGHPASLVSFSPDGKRLQGWYSDSMSSERTLEVFVWDLDGNKPYRATIRHLPLPGRHNDPDPGHITSVDFSADGKCMVSGSYDGPVLLWTLDADDARTSAPRNLMRHAGLVRSVSFSPDGKFVCSVSEDGIMLVWDLDADEELSVAAQGLFAQAGGVASVSFSPVGQRLAIVSEGGPVFLWDIEADEESIAEIHPLKGHVGLVTSVSFSPDGKRVVSGSDDGTVCVWKVEAKTEAVPKYFYGHAELVYSVSFSPDGKRVVSGSDDGTVRVWNLNAGGESNAESRRPEGHWAPVSSVRFSPDGTHLASGSWDRTVRVWNWKADEAASAKSRCLEGHTECVSAVGFSPDGRRVVSGSYDGTVRVWNLGAKADAVQEHCFKGHTGSVEAVSYSPDGNCVASGGADKTVRVWNLGAKADAAQEHCFSGPRGSVQAVTFSPDGKRLASNSFMDRLGIWNLEAGGEVKADLLPSNILDLSFSSNEPITFSPDGLIVVIGDEVWNLKDVQVVNAKSEYLKGHTDEVLSGTFSTDGKRFASGSKDRAVQLWDLASGQSIARLELAGPVHALWWNAPEQPNTLLAACIMQLDGVYFPVIYRLRLTAGPVK